MDGTTAAYRYDIGLFGAYGVELEYMIVDARTLDVMPIADRLLAREGGPGASDASPPSLHGAIDWSNELTAHLIEFKTAVPAPSLNGLDEDFLSSVRLANAHLREEGAMLLPTAMHPWMDPEREMRLWPHEYGEVYALLDRIFSCRGHGWANLQSAHLNLPFADDEEFGRLHAAIRCILPLIPALAASSPIVEGRVTGLRDTRLETYRTNSRRIPSCAARVIPEAVFTREAYGREIFRAIDADLAPFDPARILHHEWMNARGCIARFMRGAIEIRLVDVQENPRADCAILRLICAVLEALTRETLSPLAAQQAIAVEPLHAALLAGIRDAEDAVIDDRSMLSALGLPTQACRAGDAWRRLRERTLTTAGPWDTALDIIERRGTLATRILRAAGAAPSRDRLRSVYFELAGCLEHGHLFDPT